MPSLINAVTDRHVSVNAAATELGVSRHFVLVAIAAKRLEASVVAGRFVICRSHLERFRAELKRDADFARQPA